MVYGGFDFEPFEVLGVLVVGDDTGLLGTLNRKRI